jgi:hypothetical protein
MLLKEKPLVVRKLRLMKNFTATPTLKFTAAECLRQLTLWDLGSQQATVDFQGGNPVDPRPGPPN